MLYVDDMLIASKEKKEIKEQKHKLNTKFEMKNLGPAKKILGMEIHRGRKEEKLFIYYDSISTTCQIVSLVMSTNR